MTITDIGLRRRLQALVALGWPTHHLATRLGWAPERLYSALHAPWYPFSQTAADQVTALYEQLAMTPGPDPALGAQARHAGWAAPLAWDDDDLDNPAARPAAAWAPNPKKGRPIAELVEDYRDTFDHHQGDINVAAARLGMKPASLATQLGRAVARGYTVAFHGKPERMVPA